MRAVVIYEHGGPEVLRVKEVAQRELTGKREVDVVVEHVGHATWE